MTEIAFEQVVEHCLTIIGGYTGIRFASGGLTNVTGVTIGEPNKANVASAHWDSIAMDITGGPLGLVAKDVRVNIRTPVLVNDLQAVMEDSLRPVLMGLNDQYEVQVLFIYTRMDGNQFVVPRTLSFNGPYFRRFEN